MALKYVTRFKVKGSTAFPLDMLRHDACFPRNVGDAFSITNTITHKDKLGTVTICLAKHHELRDKPNITDGRWASFGWHVDLDSVSTWRL